MSDESCKEVNFMRTNFPDEGVKYHKYVGCLNHGMERSDSTLEECESTNTSYICPKGLESGTRVRNLSDILDDALREIMQEIDYSLRSPKRISFKGYIHPDNQYLFRSSKLFTPVEEYSTRFIIYPHEIGYINHMVRIMIDRDAKHLDYISITAVLDNKEDTTVWNVRIKEDGWDNFRSVCISEV